MNQQQETLSKGYSFCHNVAAFDKNIKSELGLLIIISSLTAKTGECTASNFYLAEVFETSEITISRKINKLLRFGYISIEYKNRGAEVISRKIRLTKLLTDGYQKSESTVNKNVKDNSTSNNSTIINKKKIKKESDLEKPKLDYSNIKKETWDRWVEHKSSQFKFKYKKIESEQISLNQLILISQDSDLIANEIINNSIVNGWKGLFELKNKSSSGKNIVTKELQEKEQKNPNRLNLF